MIGKLIDRIPDEPLRRFAKRVNLVLLAVLVVYEIVWWFGGLKAYLSRHFDFGAALLLSCGWAPLLIPNMILQGLVLHKDFKRSERSWAQVEASHDAFIAALRAQTAPPPPPPAVH